MIFLLHTLIESIAGLLFLFYPNAGDLVPGFGTGEGPSFDLLMQMYGLAALFLAALSLIAYFSRANRVLVLTISGALAAFQGMQPTFDYLNSDQLPNDALLGTALWYKDDSASEWMNRITLEGNTDNHKWNVSSFIGLSKVEMYTTASYAFATYESQPRLLTATLVDDFSSTEMNMTTFLGAMNVTFETTYNDGNQETVTANYVLDSLN